MKTCPHCHTPTLQPTVYHNQQVDVCRTCKGLWFDEGELDLALASADDDYDTVDVEKHPGQAVTNSDRLCPICSAPMTSHNLLAGYQVEVERCPQNHGIWVDKDELEATHHASQLHQHLGELNGKVNWKTWVFQFLTQMPVEYNIKPKRKPWMTWLLILVNTVIFLSGFVSVDLAKELYSGVMVPNEISHGQHLVTLITSQFLHGGWMHLIGNMYFLWLTGDNLEDALGHWRFLLVYLLCGTAAALAQTSFMPNSPIPTLGASGAIAGLFGMYLLWFRKASITFMFFVYQKKLPPWGFFLIWIGFNILGMVTNSQGVAYMAHIGGFVTGLIIGWVLLGWVRARYPVLTVLEHPKLKIRR